MAGAWIAPKLNLRRYCPRVAFGNVSIEAAFDINVSETPALTGKVNDAAIFIVV